MIKEVTHVVLDTGMHPGWTVILPVKALHLAKSRIAAGEGVGSLRARALDSRSHLARAFLCDVLDAVAMVPRVRRTIVATADPDAGQIAMERGALVIDDTGHPGINAAAVHAAQTITGTSIAVLVSDLPGLTPEALDRALALGEAHDLSFITDAEGIGTTLWMTTPPLSQPPAFGPSSRDAHIRTGAVDLVALLSDPPDLAAVRRDVDTLDDLTSSSKGRWGVLSAAAVDTLLSAPRHD